MQLVQLAAQSLTIAAILLRYRACAQDYHVKNGEPTKELAEMRLALRPLRKLYGGTQAREFGPLNLKSVRQQMIDDHLSRGIINHRVDRIKRFFKWSVSEDCCCAAVATSPAAMTTWPSPRSNRQGSRTTQPDRLRFFTSTPRHGESVQCPEQRRPGRQPRASKHDAIAIAGHRRWPSDPDGVV